MALQRKPRIGRRLSLRAARKLGRCNCKVQQRLPDLAGVVEDQHMGDPLGRTGDAGPNEGRFDGFPAQIEAEFQLARTDGQNAELEGAAKAQDLTGRRCCELRDGLSQLTHEHLGEGTQALRARQHLGEGGIGDDCRAGR